MAALNLRLSRNRLEMRPGAWMDSRIIAAVII
jgi:hypothetical protein